MDEQQDAMDQIYKIIAQEIERERDEKLAEAARLLKEKQDNLNEWHEIIRKAIDLLPDYLKPFVVNNCPTVYDPGNEDTNVFPRNTFGFFLHITIPYFTEISVYVTRKGSSDQWEIHSEAWSAAYYTYEKPDDAYETPTPPTRNWSNKRKLPEALRFAQEHYLPAKRLQERYEIDCAIKEGLK